MRGVYFISFFFCVIESVHFAGWRPIHGRIVIDWLLLFCFNSPTLYVVVNGGKISPVLDILAANMELEDLDNINKSDFLPLLPLNIKEELLDAGGEPGNLVCDSAERQVSVNVWECELTVGMPGAF